MQRRRNTLGHIASHHRSHSVRANALQNALLQRQRHAEGALARSRTARDEDEFGRELAIFYGRGGVECEALFHCRGERWAVLSVSVRCVGWDGLEGQSDGKEDEAE